MRASLRETVSITKSGFVKEYWIDEEHWDYDDPEDPQFYDLVGSVKYAHCDIIE